MNHKLLLSASLPAGLFLFSSISHAAIYWDTNGATSGTGTVADGAWDTTTTNWSTDVDGNASTGVFTASQDVVFAAGDDMTSASITVSGTHVVNSVTFEEGATTISTNGNDTFRGSASNSAFDINVSSGASVIMTGSSNSTANFNIEGTFEANSIYGGGGMIKTGSGTATFHRLDASLTVNGGTVIYTGNTGAKLKNLTVNNGGKIEINGSAFDTATRNIAVNGTGIVEFGAGVDQTISFFTGDGSMVGNGSTLRVGGDNKSTTFNGSITGDLDLYAIGTGTFTLSDATSMEFVIGQNGVNNSILGSGNINLNGTFSFDLTDADLSSGNEWMIVDVASLNEAFGGTFNISGFSEDGSVWTNGSGLSFSEATGMLTMTAVPEPSSYALLLGVSTITLVALRRRDRA